MPQLDQNLKRINNLKVFIIFYTFFIITLITPNIVAQKVAGYAINFVPDGYLIIPGGAFVFCFSFIINDLMTEIYGYKWSRFMIWLAVVANLAVTLIIYIAIHLPAAPFWHDQESYEKILGSIPRVIFASSISILCAEFINSYLISKSKVLCDGRYFGFRAVLSTVISVFADSILFIPIAYYGVVHFSEMVVMAIWLFAFKVFYEIIMLVFTYKLRTYLLKFEGEEVFDIGTNYSPFSLDTSYSSDQKINRRLNF